MICGQIIWKPHTFDAFVVARHHKKVTSNAKISVILGLIYQTTMSMPCSPSLKLPLKRCRTRDKNIGHLTVTTWVSTLFLKWILLTYFFTTGWKGETFFDINSHWRTNHMLATWTKFKKKKWLTYFEHNKKFRKHQTDGWCPLKSHKSENYLFFSWIFPTNVSILALETAMIDECYAEEYIRKEVVHNFSGALRLTKFPLSTQRDESSGTSSSAPKATSLGQSSWQCCCRYLEP